MTIAILVHGGAGKTAPDDDARAAQEGCLRAARAGHAVLAAGGSALEAVEAACVALEDDPRFNAGTGSCLTAEGEVECDASVMEGEALRAGAVALVRTVKNPIRLARAVMERSPHLFMAGEGAEQLARTWGLATVAPSELVTERALRRWRAIRAPEGSGTVGAVALDGRGHLAAATSTGGMNGKWRGRIGDSPLIGAGTWADDLGGAVSCTGHGERIIRVALARHAGERMRAGAPAQAAAESALRELGRVGGDGGLIAVDREGRLGVAFDTERMARAWIDAAGGEGTAFDRA